MKNNALLSHLQIQRGYCIISFILKDLIHLTVKLCQRLDFSLSLKEAMLLHNSNNWTANGTLVIYVFFFFLF